MTNKKFYLLNFSGPNFLARFATLFNELREKDIETLDFQYQSYMGFGTGLLYLEAPAKHHHQILKYAEDLDWKSSFVSSNLPVFYREQNAGRHPDVRFLLLDDEYEEVLDKLEDEYGAERRDDARGAASTLRLKTGQVWHFVCARDTEEARRKLTEPAAGRCDILLLDMNLNPAAGSGYDGIGFFDELRAADRLLPTVVITQGTPPAAGSRITWDKKVVNEYWRAGAWNFLYKAELHPRLSDIVDLMVDRRTEPLVVVVTSEDLSADLFYLFDFLRNESVKVVRASCAPGFGGLAPAAAGPRGTRLVLECAKHESISATELQEKFIKHAVARDNTSVHRRFLDTVNDWVRFHHGRIYEAMSLR